jgi:ERI1 exoribonuclease 3
MILLVLDFEANCLKDKIPYPQEIIEIPVVAYDTDTDQIIGQFHTYCQTFIPISPFCTELTGITQEMVDSGEQFDLALKSLEKWVFDVTNGNKIKSMFITCGDWDFKTALVKHCKCLNIPVPKIMREWCNIKTIFHATIGKKPGGMLSMLNQLKIEHFGRHHSGIDDAKNITEIARELTKRKCKWRITRSSIYREQ